MSIGNELSAGDESSHDSLQICDDESAISLPAISHCAVLGLLFCGAVEESKISPLVKSVSSSCRRDEIAARSLIPPFVKPMRVHRQVQHQKSFF